VILLFACLVLGDKSIRTSLDTEVPRFVKKLRDCVMFKEEGLPWRRSGLWTAVKITLQLLLQRELGSKRNGLVLYKIIVIKFLEGFLIYEGKQENCNRMLEEWIVAEMMAKIGRRAWKLEKLLELKKVSNESIASYDLP
jgi:hypothetical protein